ncbi:MAG TPA: RNA 2',3'-cyclic phosphodiesterase [Actinomycetes bacterium]|nr:RNA 2',3'-cyclic phosphodiesterase [Actinomycetes bacterium]
MSRPRRSRSGAADPTVADPDLLAGRLFFGVPVPGPARGPLEAALPRLEPMLTGARLTPPGGWHLTLAFLGQVQPEMAGEVVRVGETAVAGVGPARLRLEGAGTFPAGRRARVLWAGMGGDVEVLVRLAAALSSACKAAGLRSEDRPLAPHLTLARFSTPAPVPQEALVLVAEAAAAGEPWETRELACFRSTLGGPRGARYRVVREFPLTGRA